MRQPEHDLNLPSPIQRIEGIYDIVVDIKRDDLIHPEISGNKFRKLKYNLIKASDAGANTLLTFGGPYSNHIAAVAVAADNYGFESIGIIRGENFKTKSHTILEAEKLGMKMIYVPISEFDQRYNYNYHDQIKLEFPLVHIINEGGANYEGLMGTMEVMKEVEKEYDYVCCACGTGTTAAGILISKPAKTKLLVFGVFKSNEGISSMISERINLLYNDPQIVNETMKDLQVVDATPGLGYAKVNDELKNFAIEFYKQTRIPLDLIYTAKMMKGLHRLIQEGFFKKGDSVLVYHSGGLQGNKGFDFQL